MAHTFTAYSFTEMARETAISATLVVRIKELIDSHKVTVRASKGDDIFVAYADGCPLSRKAVLHVHTRRRHVVVESDNRPKDMLAKVAEILTQEAKVYGKL